MYPGGWVRWLSGGAVGTWSTDTVMPGEGFAYWREVVCQAVLNVATHGRDGGFRGSISGADFGGLRVAAFDSSSHEIERSRHLLARAPADHYLISLQRRGQSRITQEGAEFPLDPGEIAVIDGQRPFRIAFPAEVSRVVAVVPRRMLEARAPWLRRAPGRRIGAQAVYADLARAHLCHMADHGAALNEAAAGMLADNLCNLLALATGGAEGAEANPEAQTAAIVAFCRRNLADPDLSPQRVADHFGISLRTVHSRFARLDQSFGRWLLAARLDACATTLRAPDQAGSGIAEVAYRWGFNDLSHFNKCFRQRFAMTPRQWRLGL